MKGIRVAQMIGTGILATACVHTGTVMLGGTQRYAPIDPSSVTVFGSEADIPGEYVKVAYITAEGAHGWTSEEGMVEKAQEEAAKVDANGIVINEIEEPSAGAKIAGGFLGIPAQRTGRLLAVRYDQGVPGNQLPYFGDYTIPTEVPVYSSPDTLSAPESHLSVGHVVTVVRHDTNWATVRYAMGKEAYLRIADLPAPETPLDDPQSPCADSLYQALLKIDVNEMSEREFMIFRDRDQACTAYRNRRRIR